MGDAQMVTIKALLDEGRLQDALAEAIHEVKARPSDASRRTLLFELLCFAGDFDRALRQLDVIGEQSAEAEIGVQAYRQLIRAERARQGFFFGGEPPIFLYGPPAYVALHLSAVKRVSEGSFAEAAGLLEQAEEARTALTGRVNGEPFGDFRDCDDFTAPVIELLLRDDYVWLPFADVRRLEIAPPRYLRDLLWLPAHFETRQGVSGEAYLPALYAGSNAHEDESVKLGRVTTWREAAEGLFIAAGRHIWLAGEDEIELPAVRTLEFAEADAVPQSAVAGTPEEIMIE